VVRFDRPYYLLGQAVVKVPRLDSPAHAKILGLLLLLAEEQRINFSL
jgi:hypothetical protein